MTFMSSKGAFMRAKGMISSAGGGFLPTDLENLVAWYRFNTDVTVVGAGVDTWTDQSGNGNDLRQTTDTNRPSKESDGSVLGDGVDNYLRATFTLVQPYTVYQLAQWVSYELNDHVYNGVVANCALFKEQVSGRRFALFNGSTTAINTDWVEDTYAVVQAIHNGASSSLRIDKNAETTGNVGVNDPGGFTLGASNTPANFSNDQHKEVIIYSVAHDSDTRTQVVNYLSGVGGLGL